MPDCAPVGSFFTVTIILLLIAGPSVLFVVARAVDQGFRAAALASIGLALGDSVLVVPRKAPRRLSSLLPRATPRNH